MFLKQLDIVALSFIVFILLMVLVGVWSSRQATNSTEDYLLAGRKVHPWVMALSMLSTHYSGFMFIGPLMVIRCFDWDLDSNTSILMVIVSSLVVIAWRFVFHLHENIHEVMPGVLAALLIYWSRRNYRS